MQAYKKEFIEFMIECGVLTFGDFVTKSGRNTPFFVNTGNYQTGSQLKKLGEFYGKAIKENFADDYNIVFGPAYKGIPLAVTVTMALSDMYGIDVNYCSNRKEVKDHGDTGILLGSKLNDGDRVLIVEDVTTSGKSIYETMPILKEQGNVDAVGLVISVNRMEKGMGEKSALVELEEKYGFKTCAIVTMAEVIEYLHNKEINGTVLITDEVKGRIDEYYVQYGAK